MIVKINADVYAYYEYQCPSYRIWVDDTLYNEREFWTDCLSNYIQEEMHVDLEPGMHSLTIEKISSPHAKIWIEKAVVETEKTTEIFNFAINPDDKQTIKFLIN